jgi:hypothetical protein
MNKKAAPDKMSAEMECDYDRNPSTLYLAIQQRDWKGVKYQADSFPEEVRTIIFRKDPVTNVLKWRLLPIHAAILSDAPIEVLQTLLASYMKGVKSQDDKGMLPIHLAMKKHMEPATINLLLAAYPNCIDVKSSYGFTPYEQAKTSSSAHKAYYMRALKQGPTYSAVTESMSDLLCGVSFPSMSEMDPRAAFGLRAAQV